jgi:hypothetical protein
MKTYEEMAQSVISRAKAHKSKQNRIIAGSVAAVLVLGLCMGALVKNRPAHEPTLQTPLITEQKNDILPTTEAPSIQTPPSSEETNYRVAFLTTAGEGTTKMEPGMVIPLKSQLRVKDVTGMTEAEIEAVAKAEKDYADNLIAGCPDAKGPGWMQFNPSHGTDESKHLVITYIYVGCMIIKTDDISQIESIRATTKNSTITIPAFISQQREALADDLEAYWNFYDVYPVTQDYMITGESLKDWYYIPYGGIQVNLGLGDGVARYLNENPVPLSQISETLTFTVTYVDGTVETHTIDMIFNDNGEIYATYWGADATV